MSGRKLSQIAMTQHGPIEYCWEGEGPVIVICHGTSENCYSQMGHQSLLNAGFSILVPSRPGYGRTPLQTGSSAEAAADAIAGLLDCLGIKTCAVVSVSGGGPTGIALAARHPQRVRKLVLLAAVSDPLTFFAGSAFARQRSFYGPLHGLSWGMLRMVSNISPRGMARQTMAIFSSHNTDEALSQLDQEDIENIRRFYHGDSSRVGAVADQSHQVGESVLQAVQAPTLVMHSREDASVPFQQAELSLAQIPNAELYEGGCTGHFLWVGPGREALARRMAAFLAPTGDPAISLLQPPMPHRPELPTGCYSPRGSQWAPTANESVQTPGH